MDLHYTGGPHRTVDEELDSICAEIGYEWFFELQTVQHPPVFCEPTWYDSEFPPDEPMPDHAFMADEVRVCQVHDEYWPCAAVRAGRPVTFPPTTVENVFVCRPKGPEFRVGDRFKITGDSRFSGTFEVTEVPAGRPKPWEPQSFTSRRVHDEGTP